ncbi:DUF1501 domain-containing protein [Cucumibacter marinus]|uniref:DUF1501 domain-containing protein n=1 Tax=Cucumibacter marinus TaxID=1121252 RepID=UPI000405F7DD|nr:DUF1501 domain-containing protein [Cucumibacter marinus]
MQRRTFLKAAGASAVLTGFPVHGYTSELPKGRIAVLFLEGGLDGLAAVPPVGDPQLERMRSDLVASKPLDLNPFFALHQNLSGFGKLLASNQAAIFHATNFPYIRRSHFEGQRIAQSGMINGAASPTGWLGRAMDEAGIAGRSLTLDTPLLVRGAVELDSFYPASLLGSVNPDTELLSLLSQSHEGLSAATFGTLYEKALADENLPRVRDPEGLALATGRAMSAPEGPRVTMIRIPEFDTHANQGNDTGLHPELLGLVDRVIENFRIGLGDAWQDTVIFTLTEFGRTVRENGSAGTDHGYGSAGLVAGGLVDRAGIVSNWPGLGEKDQFEGRDLMATLDYRSVCAACIETALGLPHDVIAEKVFLEPDLARVTPYVFNA